MASILPLLLFKCLERGPLSVCLSSSFRNLPYLYPQTLHLLWYPHTTPQWVNAPLSTSTYQQSSRVRHLRGKSPLSTLCSDLSPDKLLNFLRTIQTPSRIFCSLLPLSNFLVSQRCSMSSRFRVPSSMFLYPRPDVGSWLLTPVPSSIRIDRCTIHTSIGVCLIY